jgi:hypothetical protein
MHLINQQIIDQDWDHDQMNSMLASLLAEPSGISPTTNALVAAMDWHHAAEEMIKPWQAEATVRRILDDSRLLEQIDVSRRIDAALNHTDAKFLKCSLAPGRLLSLLMAEMCTVRSPPSMAFVWISLIKSLRKLIETKNLIPNLHRIDSSASTVIGQLCTDMDDSTRSSYLDLNDPTVQNPRDSIIGQKMLVSVFA